MSGMLVVPHTWRLEHEVHHRRLAAAEEFARVNSLNQIKVRHQGDRLGIITAGKSYADLMTALRNLGIDELSLEANGIRILKLALVYPLERTIIEEFADGLDEIVVIEEKRKFIELQLRDLLFHRSSRPLIHGKQDSGGHPLFPSTGELDAEIIARGLARWLHKTPAIDSWLQQIAAVEARFPDPIGLRGIRAPSYCSGCPHNRSTYLLEGQIAGGGIGCHGMASLMGEVNRGIQYIGQMGGEGAMWIGMAPFTDKKHLFQNIGDGTYFHSGRTALNAAIAAGINITYRILYNGAVAMTGGQQVAGGLKVEQLTKELEAEGAKRIVLLTDDTSKYDDPSKLAGAVKVRDRRELETVLAELETHPGTTVLIYDQMCAAEKRRLRNRGKLPSPTRRIVINERVCEGCGDCVVKSNCVSVTPVDTEFGPKRRIHQSSCNADYTCTWGDCPALVSVIIEQDTGLKRRPLPDLPAVDLREPPGKVTAEGGYHILMPGVGGTGVVTINAILAVAALVDGLHAITLDQTGVAQKGGTVVSHLTISDAPLEAANRTSCASADLLLGFDLMGAAFSHNLKRATPERTIAVINSREIPTGESVRKGLPVLSTDDHF
ncbi:MAG: 2-oxoacid ferredoxin oxidoreductase, partial [bacterium]|nr:2-oxoacid ferredoxin oxidoreductase [bacterium]